MKEDGKQSNIEVERPPVFTGDYLSQENMNMLSSSNKLLTQLLAELQDVKACVDSRLTSVELQLSLLVHTCNKISSRLDDVEKNQNVLVGSQQSMNCAMSSNAGEEADAEQLGKLFLTPCTRESDYPCGSWLGDPKIPTKRVRCSLHPAKLFHVNTTCLTSMKMALTLLDHLFTQEQLAMSNISGRSNKGKKQLSPVLVFGIKCHLEYKFLINEKDWSKICQSIDAKCRFMWKKRNMSMTNKISGKRKIITTTEQLPVAKCRERNISAPQSATQPINFHFDQLTHSDIDFNSCVKVITETPCELRIVNATREQIAQLQESQSIILAQDILPDTNEEKSILIDDSPDLSMNTVAMSTDEELKEQHLEVVSSKDDQPPHLHQITAMKDEILTIHEDLNLEVELHSGEE